MLASSVEHPFPLAASSRTKRATESSNPTAGKHLQPWRWSQLLTGQASGLPRNLPLPNFSKRSKKPALALLPMFCSELAAANHGSGWKRQMSRQQTCVNLSNANPASPRLTIHSFNATHHHHRFLHCKPLNKISQWPNHFTTPCPTPFTKSRNIQLLALTASSARALRGKYYLFSGSCTWLYLYLRWLICACPILPTLRRRGVRKEWWGVRKTKGARVKKMTGGQKKGAGIKTKGFCGVKKKRFEEGWEKRVCMVLKSGR